MKRCHFKIVLHRCYTKKKKKQKESKYQASIVWFKGVLEDSGNTAQMSISKGKTMLMSEELFSVKAKRHALGAFRRNKENARDMNAIFAVNLSLAFLNIFLIVTKTPQFKLKRKRRDYKKKGRRKKRKNKSKRS